jgi:RNA-directed DNA polymerase
MSGKRQNHQSQLAFLFGAGGEASRDATEGTEPLGAERATETPAGNQQVMEAVCERENLREALQRVKGNKGSPGIDGMTVEQLPEYLKQHWPEIREQLLNGTYEPQPVKRVEIPKPDGGVRQLGIPTASANCTGPQIAFGMGRDLPSFPSAPRSTLPSLEGAPNSRH